MKVLFLDCDGVLNMYTSGGALTLNRARLRLLEKIIKDTGARIVVSSTWRKYPDHLKKLNRALRYRGMNIYGSTPVFYTNAAGERSYRGHEIQHWLDEHPEVENYVILDDDSDVCDSQLRHFVQTDGDIGLTKNLAYRAIYILNNGATKIE